MYIDHITNHTADDIMTMKNLENSGEISPAESKIFEKIMGLSCVPREEKITQLQQLTLIVEKLIGECTIDHSKIKYVLYSHTCDYPAPWSVNILHTLVSEFQLTNAIYFGTTLAKCAGAFHLIKLAETFFHDLSDEDCILLLIGDIAFTKMLRHIPGSTILGDAATAILLKKTGHSHRIIDIQLETYGQFSKGLWADHSEQLEFQDFYIPCLCKLIKNLVAKNNLELSKITCIFPHNVNTISWKQVISALSISDNQVYLDNVSKTAHCFGSDPFINLQDGIIQKRIVPGNYYLLVSMGLGATFAAMLAKY